MKAADGEWADKAEADVGTSEREFRVRRSPNLDAICFHAQQAAEKYLQGVLCAKGLEVPRTHDLEVLLNISVRYFPLWEALRSDLQLLTQFAVGFRYPGESADRLSARQSRDAIRRVRSQIREFLFPGSA